MQKGGMVMNQKLFSVYRLFLSDREEIVEQTVLEDSTQARKDYAEKYSFPYGLAVNLEEFLSGGTTLLIVAVKNAPEDDNGDPVDMVMIDVLSYDQLINDIKQDYTGQEQQERLKQVDALFGINDGDN